MMQGPGFAFLQHGQTFRGRYRVVRGIAAGGMGAVYEVVDETTNSRRALKVMLPNVIEDADMRARFEQEAKITGGIESDHIVRVFDAGVDEATSTPFIVMELLKGEDLAAMLRRRGPLPPAEVVTYLEQAARALDKTHKAGIIHRDLKPENLFVTTRDDGSPCVKVLDFGIAKIIAHHGQTGGTQAIGTPVYMAPEQIRGKGGLGPAVDVYALGHIAYTLLVGEPYWDEEKKSAESLFPLFTAIVEGPAEPPVRRAARRAKRELPSGLDAWFLRATAMSPAERPSPGSEAVAALGRALETPTTRMIEVVAEIAAEGRGDWGDLGKRKLSWRWPAAGGAIFAAAIALLVVRGAREPKVAPVHHKPTVTAPTVAVGAEKLVEDALFLVGIEDFEGAHLKLLGIPEKQRPTDDPSFVEVEKAWAKWKLEQVEKATDAAKKREILKEIIMAETAPAQQRKKALDLLSGIEGK